MLQRWLQAKRAEEFVQVEQHRLTVLQSVQALELSVEVQKDKERDTKAMLEAQKKKVSCNYHCALY